MLDATSLGLGLHVCHCILQVLGSELKIESKGNISTFSFQLKLEETDLPIPEVKAAQARMDKITERKMRQFDEQSEYSSSGSSDEPSYMPGFLSGMQSETFREDSSSMTSDDSEEKSMEVGLECMLTPHVLIVEDNRISQICVMHTMESLGFVTDTADNGRIALDKIQANPQGYDVILMDLRMPVMDGMECTSKIRKDLKLEVPILALTAEYTLEVKENCTQLGMNGFLTKPTSKEELRTELERILNRKLRAKPPAQGGYNSINNLFSRAVQL